MTAETRVSVEQADELLPCPFCGEHAAEVETRAAGHAFYGIDCQGCGAQVHESDPQRAALLWNTRHRLAALASSNRSEGEGVTWATASDDQRARAQLLADVELHLRSARVFLTSREKMHPCGVELHDELAAKVTAALDAIGREKVHG